MARPVQCAPHRESTPRTMGIMWLWCQCWRRMNKRTRPSVNTTPRKIRRTCRPCMHRTYPRQIMCPMSRNHLMQIYGDTQWIRSSAAYYRLEPSRRRQHSNQSRTGSMPSGCISETLVSMDRWLRLSRG